MKSLAILNECMFSKEQKAFFKKNFADVVIYNDTRTEKQAIERIGKRNIIIMDQFMFPVSENLLKACPELELLIVNTTAYDAIDLSLLTRYHVTLAHLRDYATEDVAEVALGMVLTLNTNLKLVETETAKNTITDMYPGHPLIARIKRKRLKNQTIGIVGLGNIGQCCAAQFQALGMTVLGFNRSRKYIPGVQNVPLRELFRKSDIILVTMAYNKQENERLLNEQLLTLAKDDALLISVSHPHLIDIAYLIKHPEKFRGIGFDYLVTDEIKKLIATRNNTIITPHLGSQSEEAITNMSEALIEIAVSFCEGKPLSVVT